MNEQKPQHFCSLMMSIIAFKMVLQLNSVILIKELKRGVEPNTPFLNLRTFWFLKIALDKILMSGPGL